VAKAVRLYLVRHADVANPRHVLYGHLPGYPLSRRGVEQAEATGRYLGKEAIRVIRTSPLERAQQTAAIIAGHLGSPVIAIDEDLLEARFSRYLQGVPYAQVPWRRPLWWIHMVSPGVLRRDETVGAMAARVERALLRALEDAQGQSAVCVSHGDPIQALWVRHLGRPAWALHRLQCAKGGLLALDYEGRRLSRITYVPPETQSAPAPAATAGIDHG
jgi:broad specificity phosphatase PhoE